MILLHARQGRNYRLRAAGNYDAHRVQSAYQLRSSGSVETDFYAQMADLGLHGFGKTGQLILKSRLVGHV